MHEADLVGVHEARIAHHVAAVGQIDRQNRAAAVGDGAGAVVVEVLVVVSADVAAGENFFEVLEERRVDGHHVFEVTVLGAILNHQDLAVAFDDLGFDLAHFFILQDLNRHFAVEDLLTKSQGRISGRGNRFRGGQPRVGRTFSHDLSSGLSDHFGVKEAFGLIELRRSKTCHAALAATVTTFSAYLIGLCMSL